MNYGTTFSHRFIQELGLNVQSAFGDVLQMKFDLLRLSVYWNESQPTPDTINLDPIVQLLEKCQHTQQHVVLTLGMKAPRWPEFYLPSWVNQQPQNLHTQQAFLDFLRAAFQQLKNHDCISYWQIENEPLDPSGLHHWTVQTEFLDKEIKYIQANDHRPILLTTWGNELSKRHFLPLLAQRADVVGIDVYGHQYQNTLLLGPRYVGPQDSDQQLLQLFSLCSKPVWVTELQAEPWEKGEVEYKSDYPKSMSVPVLEQHLKQAERLHRETVFFWGVEYWLWRAKVGDSSYLDFWQKIKNSAT